MFYSVMLQCKPAQGKQQSSTRTSVCKVLRLAGLRSRQILHMLSYDIFTVDEFITSVTYHHLMLEDVRTGKHPIKEGSVSMSNFNYGRLQKS